MVLKKILTMFAVLALLSSTALAVSSGSVTRSLSAASISPDGNVTVSLTTSPSSLFAFYQVIETLPAGFTFVSSTPVNGEVTGQQVKFTSIGSGPITYVVRAPSTENSYTFSGTFKDADLNSGIVSGDSQLIVSGTSAGIVSRSFSGTLVSSGTNMTVTLTPSPSTLFGTPGYQVTESIPSGFLFMSTTAFATVNAGNAYTFTQLGSGPITYIITAPAVEANYSFSGSFKDQVNAVGTVSGASTITVENVIGHYAGQDNIVSRNEAVNAVLDFFSGVINKDDAIRIVVAYFTG